MSKSIFICGAGPAGSYLAYLLSKQGHNVTIADKQSFPRDKVCGGGLSQKTLDLLDFPVDEIIQRKIQGAWLCYQNKDMVESDLGERSGCSVLRSEFDNFILQKAISAGADFIPECSFKSATKSDSMVKIETTKGDFEVNYLVGADGVYSRVRKCFFEKDLVTYAPAVEILAKLPTAQVDSFEDRMLFDFGGMPRGYGWIFPKKDHLNVGIYSIYPTKSIRADLAEFISHYEILDGCDFKVLGHSIPTGNKRNIFSQDRVLLVGDAAGFAEAFYGEGIYFALRSSILAAEAFESDEKCISDNYNKLVKKHMIPDLFYSELNAKAFYLMQKFGYYRMVRNKYCNYNYGELIGGNVSYRSCFYKTLFTLPYWAFSSRIPPSERGSF